MAGRAHAGLFLFQARELWQRGFCFVRDRRLCRNHLCITFELLSINLYEFIKTLGPSDLGQVANTDCQAGYKEVLTMQPNRGTTTSREPGAQSLGGHLVDAGCLFVLS